MAKTATVAVERVIVHPVYKKRIRRIKKYQVHDEAGYEVGQVVKFAASKSYSKTKKWKVVEAVAAGKGGNGAVKKILKNAPNRKKGNTEGTEKSENTEVTKGTERDNTKKTKTEGGKK